MPKLTITQIKENIFHNTLETCEYVSGYENYQSDVVLHCIKHDYNFTTAYDNVRRASRAHHVCPICQQEDKNKNKLQVVCDYCGKAYYLSKSKYDVSNYHFCCRECKDAAQRLISGDKFNDLRPDHYGDGPSIYSYRSSAFMVYPHKCAICGWDEDLDVLQVHHIDENRQNNSIENLIILCPNCHQKLTIHKYKLVDRKFLEKI